MANHYPKGYVPQTYGEKKLADEMSTKQIEREIRTKEELKKKNPKEYRRRYCGFGM